MSVYVKVRFRLRLAVLNAAKRPKSNLSIFPLFPSLHIPISLQNHHMCKPRMVGTRIIKTKKEWGKSLQQWARAPSCQWPFSSSRSSCSIQVRCTRMWTQSGLAGSQCCLKCKYSSLIIGARQIIVTQLICSFFVSSHDYVWILDPAITILIT